MFLEQCLSQSPQIMALKQIWIILMHSNNNLYVCRVFGALQSDPPWGETGKDPSFDICDCCGVEFGYEDATLSGLKRYRENGYLAEENGTT